MKKWIAICIITILGIGMVLMSGCTGTEPVSAATIVPASPQVTQTVLATPSPIPTIVRETKPTPNLTVTTIKTPTIVPTTKPTPGPNVTTIKVPTTAVPVIIDETPGSLSIFTNGGIGTEAVVYIARQGSNVQPLSYDQYQNLLVSPGYIPVKILPNGESPSVILAPGPYIGYLPDKTGAQQPEQQSFTINANSQTILTFSGNSYRANSGGGCGGTGGGH
jgi:hypothetical protein